jgi:hypothetical protein
MLVIYRRIPVVSGSILGPDTEVSEIIMVFLSHPDRFCDSVKFRMNTSPSYSGSKGNSENKPVQAGDRLRLLFENGDDIFLRNVWPSPNYTALKSRRP